MARILLLSVDNNLTEYEPFKHFSVSALRASACVDAFGIHQVTEDPEEADVILFAETGLCGLFAERVRVHPFTANIRRSAFCFIGMTPRGPCCLDCTRRCVSRTIPPGKREPAFTLCPKIPKWVSSAYRQGEVPSRLRRLCQHVSSAQAVV
jgi:hypothetical protein